MSTWVWIVIAVAATVVLVLAALAVWRASRRRNLQQAFGPEYDRTVADAPTQREAESQLAARQKRREQFDIRPLDPERRKNFVREWRGTQERFVDDPAEAVTQADLLIQVVMRERGYPVDEFEQRAADLSVDHPDVVSNYRAAHGLSVANERGRATTEDLRTAMIHYRSLFTELLETEPSETASR